MIPIAVVPLMAGLGSLAALLAEVQHDPAIVVIVVVRPRVVRRRRAMGV